MTEDEKKKASTYLTGGGGFNFEDAIAAHYLIIMLAERHPFDNTFGRIVQIKWQVSDSGWQLDDVVLVGSNGYEAGISIKSDSHLKSTGFSEGFSKRCWRQFRHQSGRLFNTAGDLLCLGLGAVAADNFRAWRLLSNQLQTTSLERMEERLKIPGKDEGSQSSEVQRNIVKSFVDHHIDTNPPSTLSALSVLKHVRVMEFDFLGIPSRAEEMAIQYGQFLVEGGSRDDSESLWVALLAIAKEFRETGGNLSRDELANRIKTTHRLVSLPQYSQHLNRWNQLSVEKLRHANWGASRGLPPLERLSLWGSWESAMASHVAVIIVGDSGAGKTTFVKEHSTRSGRKIYFVDKSLMAVGAALYGGELSGSTYRLSQLLKAETLPSILFVDSAESLTDEEVDVIGALLAAVESLTADGHLQIVVSSQSSGFDRVRTALSRDNISSTSLSIPNPSSEEIRESLRGISRLAILASQDRMVRLFTNLKVFELTCRAAANGIEIAEQGNLKQTGILDFLWKQWIEQHGRSLVRSRLLQRLGIEDANTLTPGHVMRALDPGEIEYLPGLYDDGLLVSFEERIYFAHDAVADLSRLRVLLSSELVEVTEHAANFQWHNAVKLFSQHLAETDSDRWLSAFRSSVETSQNGASLCTRIFVDGVVAAAEGDSELLMRLWPEILGIGKQFAGLLLERTAIVGTTPDQNWAGVLPPEMMMRPGVWRVCSGDAIAAVLQCAAAESQIIVELIPNILTICEMVLRRSIRNGDVPATTSGLAAQLSCRIAEWLKTRNENRHDYRGNRENVFRAMLLAAAVQPNEVVRLALHFARRTSESGGEQDEEKDFFEFEDAQVEGDIFALLDPEAGEEAAEIQSSDGPLREVDDCFRDVCLDTDLLIPLIKARPSIAKEIILACCIEEPKSPRYRSWYDEDNVGIVDCHNRQPPLYDVGPFLDLFHIAPDEAISIMLTLCNFATDRWYASPARKKLEEDRDSWFGQKLGPFEVTVPARDGSTAAWKGSANIYAWSLGGLPNCEIITNILMAFEFWIYEQIELGNDVREHLSRVVSEGRSVGLAGCLMDIGKRHRELFSGPLMPLLGCWVVYGWDRSIRLDRESAHAGLIAWAFNSTPQRRALATHWHKADHRNLDLLEIAKDLFVESDEFRAFMETCRITWQDDFDKDRAHHGLRDLVCLFDWNNYSVVDTDNGETVITYHPPEVRLREAQARLQEANDAQLLMILPMQCRKLLDKGSPLNQGSINNLWECIQRIQNLEEKSRSHGPFPESNWSRKPNALTAAAAVMLRLGHGSLNDEMAAFCRDCFENLLQAEPQRREFDSAEAMGNHSWDYFLGDLTIEYLIRDMNDEAARWGVERCITAFHYGALSHFMNLACKERLRLGRLFPLLPGYVIAKSAISEQSRRVFSELSHYQEWADNPNREGDLPLEISTRIEGLKAQGERLTEAAETFSDAIADWKQIETDWQSVVAKSIEWLQRATAATGVRFFHEPDRTRDHVKHADVGLDLYVLQHGFDWIDLTFAENEADRDSWIAHLKGLMAVQQMLIPTLSDGQEFATFGYANKYDQFVHLLLARNLIRGCRFDLSDLWTTKLSQVSVAPDHVSAFLKFFGACACDETPDPAAFVNLWIAMLGYANASADWSRHESSAELWESLLGTDFRGVNPAWAKDVADALHPHTELVCSCLTLALKNPSCAATLVTAFTQEVWAAARLRLIETFTVAFDAYDDSDFPAAPLCKFLRLCWASERGRMSGLKWVQAAFTKSLNRVVACGVPAGNLLVAEIEQSKLLG